MRDSVDTGNSIVDRLPDTLGDEKVVLGFNGAIDRVREIVDEWQSRDTYQRIQRLDDFGQQVSTAGQEERSMLMEWVRSDMRTGALVCHISRALGKLDFDPVMIGMFGDPPKEVFLDEFSQYRMESLGEPAYTDAIEFDDGKLMLSESGDMRYLDWEMLCAEVGFDQLAAYLDGAAVLGMGYWAEISDLVSIFEGITDEIVPTLSDPPEHILIDPADVGTRPSKDIKQARDVLQRLDAVSPVTMSANRYETIDIANSLRSTTTDRSPEAAAEVAREEFGISRFVTHGATMSALATEDGVFGVDVPREDEPVLSTGAGDHFNAGFLLGLMYDLGPEESVALGNAVAGCFVRQGDPPTYEKVEAFLQAYTLTNWQSTS
jgi:sugar/nucleoside kinase (ribokinase family)